MNNKNTLLFVLSIISFLFVIASVSASDWTNNRDMGASGSGLTIVGNVTFNSTYYVTSINLTNNITTYVTNNTYYNITNNITNNITTTYNITNNNTYFVTNNTYYNITNNITNNFTTVNNISMNYTNLALTNESENWGTNNLTTGGWFNGKFNWTALANWLHFDGILLTFNETHFNKSVIATGLDAGFNSTYNSSYATSLNNGSYLSTYNNSYVTYGNASTYNVTYDTHYLNTTLHNDSTYNTTYDTWLPNYTKYSPGWYNYSTYDQAYANSLLNTTFYNTTSIVVVTGTGQGAIGDIQSYNNIPYNVSESSGDIDFRVNFTGITNFNQLIVRYKTDASESHIMDIAIWDYVLGTWESYRTVGVASDYNVLTIGVYDPADHISGGKVYVRFYTNNVGGSTHKWSFDWVSLASGPAIPSAQETDPYSYHKNTNIDATGYNITADRVSAWFNWTSLVSWLNFDGFVLTENSSDFNKTILAIGNMNNWSSTNNATYDAHIINTTLHNDSTFNSTYAGTTINWEGNFSANSKNWYNFSLIDQAYANGIVSGNVSNLTSWIVNTFLKITDIFTKTEISNMVSGNATNLTTYTNTMTATDNLHKHSISNLTVGSLGVNLDMSYGSNITYQNSTGSKVWRTYTNASGFLITESGV